MAKVKNYNLNVTVDRDSDFKNAFPGIFNFTVGILERIFWIFIGYWSLKCRFNMGDCPKPKKKLTRFGLCYFYNFDAGRILIFYFNQLAGLQATVLSNA